MPRTWSWNLRVAVNPLLLPTALPRTLRKASRMPPTHEKLLTVVAAAISPILVDSVSVEEDRDDRPHAVA